MDIPDFRCIEVKGLPLSLKRFFFKFVSSNEAHRAEKEKEEKQNRLEKRRNRLAAMLESEKLKFQVNNLKIL